MLIACASYRFRVCVLIISFLFPCCVSVCVRAFFLSRCRSFRYRRSGCGARRGAATPARLRLRPSTCATTLRYPAPSLPTTLFRNKRGPFGSNIDLKRVFRLQNRVVAQYSVSRHLLCSLSTVVHGMVATLALFFCSSFLLPCYDLVWLCLVFFLVSFGFFFWFALVCLFFRFKSLVFFFSVLGVVLLFFVRFLFVAFSVFVYYLRFCFLSHCRCRGGAVGRGRAV